MFLKKNVLIIFPFSPFLSSKETMCPPLGIYYIASLARDIGIKTRIADPILKEKLFDNKFMQDAIKDTDLVLISSNSLNWGNCITVSRKIKDLRPKLPIVLGGIHPTVFDQHALESTQANVVARGEAENILPKLFRVPEYTERYLADIPGITYLDDSGNIKRNLSSKTVEKGEFSILPPLPAYDLIPEKIYDVLPFESSRGCVHNCLFCSIMSKGNWKAFSSEETIMRLEKVSMFASRFKTDDIYFIDDCFTQDIQRASRICEGILDLGVKASLLIFSRAEQLTKTRMLEFLSKIKLTCLLVGIECGYQNGLRKIRKGISMEIIEQCSSQLKKANLQKSVIYSFIIGFPWETMEYCIKTAAFAANLIDKYGGTAKIYWYTLLPNSDLWWNRHKYGIQVEETIFDDPNWTADPDIFMKTHPQLGIRDLEKIQSTLKSYADSTHQEFQICGPFGGTENALRIGDGYR